MVSNWGRLCACVKPRTPYHRLSSGRVERGFIRRNMIHEASDTVPQTCEDRVERCDANDLLPG